MKTGMLWFDNSKDFFEMKVKRAADYYHKKYGSWPLICYVHPTTVFQPGVNIYGISIRTSRQVLPNHFWLGNENLLPSNLN